MTLAEVNTLLQGAGMPPVPESSWGTVQRIYVPWVREDIGALRELAFSPPGWTELRKRGLDVPEGASPDDDD